MVLISGIIGTLSAIWLYWNFVSWLNILNCTLPPVGIILVLAYFLHPEEYDHVGSDIVVDWAAVIGVIAGAIVANLLHWGVASINGMAVAAVIYILGHKLKR
jgi:cytosine permease